MYTNDEQTHPEFQTTRGLSPKTELPLHEDATLVRKELINRSFLQTVGEADLQLIVFHINAIRIVLPEQETVIVGRATHRDNQEQPDVDLGSFEINKNKISRRHLSLCRKGSQIYVSDLYSTNGTWVNGQRLLAPSQCMLREGDELGLGDLKIKVKFSF
jgi:pSer/pThr/pTyr-binding forkhead associated (FHA) protein